MDATAQALRAIAGTHRWGPRPAAALLIGALVCFVADDMYGRIFGSGLTSLSVLLGCLGVLGAFYSDWILAAIAENMSGSPSADNAALYWSYFVAKRLPFFSS